jgi:6,7-dimethyl-8-ribityllumazine synthase
VKIAFIQSSWHKDLVDQIKIGFTAEVKQLVAPEPELEFFEVTGAFEIPLQAQRLAASGAYDAVVAAGLVVDGGIYRHEFVADAVINGLMRVQLDTGVPVLSAVLTPHHFHEHETHRAFFFEHLETKGTEAARACAHTIEALERLPASG